MTDASRAPDEIIAGRYRIEQHLGSGGMADVFLARSVGAAGFSRTVVIKRLSPRLAVEPHIVAMFLDEARIAARLHHKNIAQVFDFGSDASGYFLAMEFLSGCDVRRLVRAAPGTLPLGAAVAITAGVAAGLHHAHEQRGDDGAPLDIVHRDVTAANIFVTTDGMVKLIDFGIARAADRTTRTQTGVVKGTVAYLSPEQALGDAIDRRSDLFQLGVVLYELVTGQRPFDRPRDTDIAVMMRIQTGAMTPPRELRPEVPEDLDALIRCLLSLDRTRRPQTAQELVEQLDAIAEAHGWNTAPTELSRLVRELAPADVLDGAATENDATAPAPGDNAAALADLLAAPRHTAPVPRRPDERMTLRDRPPAPAPGVSEPDDGAVAAPRGRMELFTPRSRILIGAALVLVVITVVVLVVNRRETQTVASPEPPLVRAPPADAARAPAPVPAPEPIKTRAETRTSECIAKVREAIANVRRLEAKKASVREIRQAFLDASSIDMTPVGATSGGNICDSARTLPDTHPLFEEVQLLGRALWGIEEALVEAETARRLEFSHQDEAGRAYYKDLKTGADVTAEDVDLRSYRVSFPNRR